VLATDGDVAGIGKRASGRCTGRHRPGSDRVTAVSSSWQRRSAAAQDKGTALAIGVRLQPSPLSADRRHCGRRRSGLLCQAAAICHGTRA